MVNFTLFPIFLLFSEADVEMLWDAYYYRNCYIHSSSLYIFLLLFYELRFFLFSVLYDKIFGIVLPTYYSICRQHCYTYLEIYERVPGQYFHQR